MRRREFIAILGSAMAAGPQAVRAQQAGKPPTIGFLCPTSASAWAPWTAAWVGRLRQLGWVDGRTVAIEYRWGEGHTERFGELAAELVRLKVDLIVTSGAALLQTEKETSTIPIVFALASDPVGTGMVQSLARPGGNATGLALESPDLAGKRLGLLRQAFPATHRLAVLADVAYSASALELGEVEAAAGSLGFSYVPMEIRRAEDIEPAFAALKERADALYVCGSDPLINTNRVRINELALSAHLPTMHDQTQYVEAGGLMSYGAAVPALFRRAAEMSDKILRGAKPADIPVENPVDFDLVINLKTAKALGVEIPQSLLLLANQVIE
jgi:putative ABC transport system substrate-binding protein